MGRAPCCDKANVKKGPWSPEEDAKLKSYIEQHGTGGNWIALPQKIGLRRCGKSCRLRWLNYLRPNLKHGGFSEEEDNIICSLYISIGSRWSIIAAQLPGRTDNDIKNYWNTKLKKKLLGKQRKEKHPGKKNKGNSTSINTTSVNSMHIPSSDPNNFQNPYWPELPPVLTHYNSHQEQLLPPPHPPRPRLNDHTSIRKLLIKLGGKFSDGGHVLDHQNLQLPSGISTSSYTSPSLHFNDQPDNSGSIHSSGLEELVSESNFVNDPQKLDGLEFMLGEDMARVIDESYSGTLCSLVYPPLGSGSGEGLIHYEDDGFEREWMSYPGSQ